MRTQTTISVELVELIVGARLELLTVLPTTNHVDAWGVISKFPWNLGQTVEPKPGETDDSAWHQQLAERVDRVLRNRPFKTTVTVLRTCGAGWPVRWKVTVHWNKPRKSPLLPDPMGVWTLRQFSKPDAHRGRIVSRIRAPLGCFGEDLYDYLPDGIPDGYDILAEDPGTVTVYPVNTTASAPYWEFSFQRIRAHD